MLRGMKETCTAATREDTTGHICIIWKFLRLGTTHKVPVTVQQDVEDAKI